MPIEVKLHGNIAFDCGPKIIKFENAFTVTDFPKLRAVHNAAKRLSFAGELSDALIEAGIPNVDSLSWFPSVNGIAYWGGAKISLPNNCGEVGILIPLSEKTYGQTSLPEGGFSLHPISFKQTKPTPFGPLFLVNGEVVHDDLSNLIESVGQAYQQLVPKLVAPLN